MNAHVIWSAAFGAVACLALFVWALVALSGVVGAIASVLALVFACAFGMGWVTAFHFSRPSS